MSSLELDDYHEKEVAELTGQIGFDPQPVSNCSQLSVIWGRISSPCPLAFPTFCLLNIGGHPNKNKI